MTQELTLLGWTLVLALIQIMLPAASRTQELGLKFAVSSRDEESSPPGKTTSRLKRAQVNLFETLPLFAAAVLIAHVAGREDHLTLTGAWLYLIARVVYLPLYAFGVPYLRTLVWSAGVGGLILILIQDLSPG